MYCPENQEFFFKLGSYGGGGQKIKSAGNVMNCPENKKEIKKKPVGGGGSFRGSTNQKSGKFHELPRKSIHFFNPPPRMERGRGGRGQGGRKGEGGRQGRRGPSEAG